MGERLVVFADIPSSCCNLVQAMNVNQSKPDDVRNSMCLRPLAWQSVHAQAHQL
jgi:hypothetical protein